jgi:uncharacterized damage-inducible protein DinB
MTDRPASPTTPRIADERETLDAFLDHYRAELLDRAWGLEPEQLHERLAPSTLTLARLIAHMTAVEYGWFGEVFAGESLPEIYGEMDFDADPDAEMTRADSLSREQLLIEFDAAVDASRQWAASAESLDEPSNGDADETYSLRWIMVHMIEEYARHCGHADFLREAIDGDRAW